jgi:hypothetical protein
VGQIRLPGLCGGCRCYGAYAEQRAIDLESAADRGWALEIFDERVESNQARRERKGIEGAFSREYAVSFHKALIRSRFDSGETWLLRITAGGNIVDCLHNFVIYGKVLIYQGVLG